MGRHPRWREQRETSRGRPGPAPASLWLMRGAGSSSSSACGCLLGAGRTAVARHPGSEQAEPWQQGAQGLGRGSLAGASQSGMICVGEAWPDWLHETGWVAVPEAVTRVCESEGGPQCWREVWL